MNCNMNGNLGRMDEAPVGESMEDPGVVEVMASPESEGPFTEEMINQVITMLQTEGQITPETHTVIVHTNGGTTLRVQLQQVDGTELENDNIEELAPDAVATDEDQLVYVGQAGEDFHTDVSSDHQLQHQDQQQYSVATTAAGAQLQIIQPRQQVLQHQQIMQNGGQFMTVASDVHKEQYLGSAPVTSVEYKSNASEEVGIPAALMSNVAEQVLQAATLIDGGYKSSNILSTNPSMAISQDISSVTAVSLQQQAIDMNGEMNVFPQSLENGVSWSIGTDQLQSVYSSPLSKGNLHQVHNLPLVSHERRSLYKGSRMNPANLSSSNPIHHSESLLDSVGSKNRTSYSTSNNMKKSYDQPIKASHTIEDNIVRICIDTGRNDAQPIYNVPSDVIRISTTTGLPKTKSTKFVRCPSCVMQLSSEMALLQHIRHGCSGSKKRTSYECTYCCGKFSSKARTVEHLRVCTMRTKARAVSKNKPAMATTATSRALNRKPATQTVEVEINSDEEDTNNNQEENIVYDDDEDVDMDLAADNEDYESQMSKVSQKHLGPILMGGKFKCRDCDRTFNKDSQYNRHIGACTNAPLNASRIDDPEHVVVPEKKPILPEKKRGRPRKVYPESKAVIANKIRSTQSERKTYNKVVSNTGVEHSSKDDLSDMDWGFLSSPKKVKGVERNTIKKSSNIMQVLKENLGDDDLVDGSKDLSESFLQCLDGALNSETVSSKDTSPNKSVSAVCGLCVRHMNSTEELALHITDIHAKDIVNMHAILSNNTDLTTHKCSMCDLHFVSTESVREHIISKHLGHLKENYRSLSVNSLDLPCPWCHHKSMTKELFQQHLASEHAQHFPETALSAPTLKPEELSTRSLKAASSSLKEHQQDLLAGRLCLKCGLAISSVAKLEQHLAFCKTDQTTGVHQCPFPECSAAAFDSLSDLIAHAEEEHQASEGCERRLFPNTSLFGSWLDQEERQSQRKYVRATSRVRGGCRYTTYLCQSYSNGDERPLGRACFARLHVKTRWCHAKFDYCGRTEVMFYKEHHHLRAPAVSHTDIVSISQDLKSRFMMSDQDDAVEVPPSCDGNSAPVPPPTPLSELPPRDQLLQQQEKQLEQQRKHLEQQEKQQQQKQLEQEKQLKQQKLLQQEKHQDKKQVGEEKRSPVTEVSEQRSQPPLNNNNDDEYFSSGSSSCKGRKMTNSTSTKSSKVGRPPKSTLACNKRQREDIDSDEEFYPVPKRRNLRATNNVKSKNNIRKGRNEQQLAKRSKLEEQEETTYVLPANLAEWCKLFDMVQNQIDNGLIKKSDVAEARCLLKHQTDITELTLEEQVRVFHRLCGLANIQVD